MSFGRDEASAIRELLVALADAESAERTAIRARLRTEFRFFITDFLKARETSMGATDFDRLVREGHITVGDQVPQDPPARTATPEPGEEWADTVEHDPATIRRQYDEGTHYWRAGLDVLLEHAPSRLTYEAVELELGWPRGRWRSVIGGTMSHAGEGGTRPFHISPPWRSRSGEWEAWMDDAQRAALRGARGE